MVSAIDFTSLSKREVSPQDLVSICENSSVSDIRAELRWRPLGPFRSEEGMGRQFWAMIGNVTETSSGCSLGLHFIYYNLRPKRGRISVTDVAYVKLSPQILSDPNELLSALLREEDQYGVRLRHTPTIFDRTLAKLGKVLSGSYRGLSQEDITARFLGDSEPIQDYVINPFNRILVVDDRKRYRERNKDLLVQGGYLDENILTAMSGEKALEVLRQDEGVSLIISDWQMIYGMYGIELLKKIRKGKAGKNYADVPFVFATGENRKKDVEKALRYRADMYFLKPLERRAELFLNTVGSLLHRYEKNK